MSLLRAIAARFGLDEPALDPALRQAISAEVASAHARWPGVRVDDDRFADWLAARLPSADLAGAPHLHVADLYLACACANGDGRALAAFDAAFVAPARASDDAKQQLRARLFVRDPGKPSPGIGLYGGRGELARWVRAALARLEIDEVRRGGREVPAEESLLDALGIDPAQSPELAHTKADARVLVQRALREAIDALGDRERAMLLQHHLDGLGVVALGKIYALDASNVSRTLARARLAIVAAMKRALARDVRLYGADLDSLLALVQSQLELTSALRS